MFRPGFHPHASVSSRKDDNELIVITSYGHIMQNFEYDPDDE